MNQPSKEQITKFMKYHHELEAQQPLEVRLQAIPDPDVVAVKGWLAKLSQ